MKKQATEPELIVTSKTFDEEDIWFVRHAESLLNIASHDYRVKHNLPYIWELLCKHKQFLSTVKYNHDFIDCQITPNGREQCMEARKFFDTIQPDVILVSPLERTLTTCDLLFSGRNIPIIAEPVLAQALRSSCDISFSIDSKVQRYPHVNFDNVRKQGDLWFLKNDSEDNQKKYFDLLEKLGPEVDHNGKAKAILDFMIQTLIFEKPENVRNRSWKIKQMLKSYKQKYNKIAVVAHYNTINYTVAKKFDITHQPANSANAKNCEILKANLNELLKYQ